MEYHEIKWVDEYTATRRTKEVDLKCMIIIPNGTSRWTIILSGDADSEHHLVEDSAILLKKMCENKCGVDHG